MDTPFTHLTLVSAGGHRDVLVSDDGSIALVTEDADATSCLRESAAVDIAALQRLLGRTEFVAIYYCDREDHADEWDHFGGYEYPARDERALVLRISATVAYDGPETLAIVDRASAWAFFTGEASEGDIRAIGAARGGKMPLGVYVAEHWLSLADDVRESSSSLLQFPDGTSAPAKSYRFSAAKMRLILEAAERAGVSTWGFAYPGELVYSDGLHAVFNTTPIEPHLRIVPPSD